MSALNGRFFLVGPGTTEVALGTGQDGAGLSINKEFVDRCRLQPAGVGIDNIDYILGLTANRNFARPG